MNAPIETPIFIAVAVLIVIVALVRLRSWLIYPQLQRIKAKEAGITGVCDCEEGFQDRVHLQSLENPIKTECGCFIPNESIIGTFDELRKIPFCRACAPAVEQHIQQHAMKGTRIPHGAPYSPTTTP